MESDSPIFIACVGKGYSRCKKRLATGTEYMCPKIMTEFCFKENSARLSGAPHDKFVYLSTKEFYGKGMTSVFVPELAKYAVFLEAE